MVRYRALILIVVLFTVISAATSTITGLLIRERLDKQVVAGCLRLNIKQREDNTSQYADFVYDQKFIELVKLGQSHRSALQRRQTVEFLGPLRAAERAKAWVPPVVDCARVPVGYKPSPPVPFYRRLPPRSAL